MQTTVVNTFREIIGHSKFLKRVLLDVSVNITHSIILKKKEKKVVAHSSAFFKKNHYD